MNDNKYELQIEGEGLGTVMATRGKFISFYILMFYFLFKKKLLHFLFYEK